MKSFPIYLVFTSCIFLVGCGNQPNVTNDRVAPNQPTPTPDRLARVEEKVDPADVIEADVSEAGPTLLVSEETDKKNLKCDKYNRVMINSSDNKITISGACNQIMVNGHRNQVSTVGASEITVYGSENTVEYSKYVNGKKPTVTDTSGSNTIAKAKSNETTPANK